jgi:hypothetical protein
MQLVPYYDDKPFDLASLNVRATKADWTRVEEAVARSRVTVREVNTDETFRNAQRIAAELKGLEKEIELAKKITKSPGQSFLNAVEELAKDISGPLLSELGRISGLMGAYVTRIEAELLAAKRKEEDLKRQVREAKDAEARLAAQLSLEIIGQKPPAEVKVPGGRIDHRPVFRLENVRELLQAGLWDLVRFELDQLACNDVVKAQLERNPEAEPKIPGVQITWTTKVHMRATSRIDLTRP